MPGPETFARPRHRRLDPVARVRGLRRRGRLRDALAAASEGLARRGSGTVASTDAIDPSESARLLVARGELLILLGDDRSADLDLANAARLARVDDPITAIRATLGRAAIARFDGRSGEARALVEDAKTIASRAPGADLLTHSSVALEAGLGGLERDEPGAIADLDDAVSSAESATRGPDRDGALALALEGRAAAHRIRGEFGEAYADLDRALPLARRAFGGSSMEVAQLLNSRGMLGKFAGRFGRAAADYRRAGRIIEGRVGPENPETAALLHNVAGLAHARGLYAEAEGPARRSLELRLRALGEDHLAVALDRAGLASILDRLGRRDEGEALLLLALPAIRRSLGPDHREVAVALNNLAAIAHGRGDLDLAERRYREALEIKSRTLGSNAPSVAITLANLSTVVRRRGDPIEAAALADRALTILRGTVGPNHPAVRAAEASRARIAAAPTPIDAHVLDVGAATGDTSDGRATGPPADTNMLGSVRPNEVLAVSNDPAKPISRDASADDEPDTEGHRLAANDDETIVIEDEPDTEGHRLASNDDETIVTEDEPDTEGHRLAGNDDESIVSDAGD